MKLSHKDVDEMIAEHDRIWNAAIEAAVEKLTELNHDGYVTDEIRKLKK